MNNWGDEMTANIFCPFILCLSLLMIITETCLLCMKVFYFSMKIIDVAVFWLY